MMNPLVVTGAYGRLYDSWDAIVADWSVGKDFKIVNGPYTSSRDVEAIKGEGYTHVMFVDTSITLNILVLIRI